MWKLVKVLRHSLCSEVTLLQSGFNSNSARNAFPAAGLAGGMRGGSLLLFGETKNDG